MEDDERKRYGCVELSSCFSLTSPKIVGELLRHSQKQQHTHISHQAAIQEFKQTESNKKKKKFKRIATKVEFVLRKKVRFGCLGRKKIKEKKKGGAQFLLPAEPCGFCIDTIKLVNRRPLSPSCAGRRAVRKKKKIFCSLAPFYFTFFCVTRKQYGRRRKKRQQSLSYCNPGDWGGMPFV
jgi:hypothetical protein